jgi:paraquat-inducible protein B
MTKKADIVKKKRISSIWLLPLVTILIGVWMFYQHLQQVGESIYIVMPTAEGVTIGKTQIRVKSVKIGTITNVKLGDDNSYVIAQAQIEQQYSHLLRKDSQIWAVKPRIEASGISGINTLLSGIYFEFQPGNTEERSYSYLLRDTPPLVGKHIHGGRYSLISDTAEVLDVGAPVVFNGFSVGQVETADFDWKQQLMTYQVFIKAPYQNLVTENSAFWVSAGIDFKLSAEGVVVRSKSISNIFRGGISFGVPEGKPAGEFVEDGREFRLHANYDESLEKQFNQVQQYVINFDQSIRGLKAGAPVEYKGIRIGTVIQSPAKVFSSSTPLSFGHDKETVPVLVQIEFGRMHEDEKTARNYWQQNIDQWVKNGLRATLKPGNLLTGSLYVDFDLFNESTQSILTADNYQVFPSTFSGFNLIANQVSAVLEKFNKLDVESSVSTLNKTLNSFQTLANDLKKLVNNNQTQSIPDNMNQTLQQIQETLSGFEKGAPLYHDLQKTLQSIERITRDLEPFSKSLNEHPNILIFDKNPKPDVQPQKKQN